MLNINVCLSFSCVYCSCFRQVGCVDLMSCLLHYLDDDLVKIFMECWYCMNFVAEWRKRHLNEALVSLDLVLTVILGFLCGNLGAVWFDLNRSFLAFEWLAGKIVPEMMYNVSSGTLNPVIGTIPFLYYGCDWSNLLWIMRQRLLAV